MVDITRNSAKWPKAMPEKTSHEVGVAGPMPGTSGFTMACFKADDVPVGTKLYIAPPPAEVVGDIYRYEIRWLQNGEWSQWVEQRQEDYERSLSHPGLGITFDLQFTGRPTRDPIHG